MRVLQEGAGSDPWALIGAASICLQGIDEQPRNLEFMTTASTLRVLGEMLDIDPQWGGGPRLAAGRLQFTRSEIPVFIFAAPVFHGRYESLEPFNVPSLWDARGSVDVDGVSVFTTPLEWELLLAVVLEVPRRTAALQRHAAEHAFDNRLLTRLLREGRVAHATEEEVWAILEGAA